MHPPVMWEAGWGLISLPVNRQRLRGLESTVYTLGLPGRTWAAQESLGRAGIGPEGPSGRCILRSKTSLSKVCIFEIQNVYSEMKKQMQHVLKSVAFLKWHF